MVAGLTLATAFLIIIIFIVAHDKWVDRVTRGHGGGKASGCRNRICCDTSQSHNDIQT